jgi:Ca2+-binding RTX toxin-like protein
VLYSTSTANGTTLLGDHGGSWPKFAGNDRLYGASGRDVMFGDGGNDYLNGAGGDDDLYGGDGDDELHGGEGDDGLAGDLGTSGSEGSDQLLARAATTSSSAGPWTTT